MAEKGIAYLKSKLTAKKNGVMLRYRFYDMKNHADDIKGIIPDRMKWVSASIGWCAKGVDTLANRIVFDGFDHDDFYLGDIFKNNNPDILCDDAVHSALIGSCSFIYIGRNSSGYPTMQVIDGSHATGEISRTTNMLTEGYAVLEHDQNGKPTLEAYFRPYRTDYYVNGKLAPEMAMEHTAPYSLLVPIIYRPDAMRPFGHSRITRCCMDTVKAAIRTIKRSDISSEFYSFPQRYVLGLEEAAQRIEGEDKYKAAMSAFLDFRQDENGNHPVVGQFEQQSMAPFTEQLKTLASVFAGETDLTLEDLGFSTGNPPSYDAIRASHENLRLTARNAQRTFGTGFLNAGYLAACVRDKQTYRRSAFREVKPEWMPIFEPDAASLGAIGDAILKINQASDGFLGTRNIKALTGLETDAVSRSDASWQ